MFCCTFCQPGQTEPLGLVEPLLSNMVLKDGIAEFLCKTTGAQPPGHQIEWFIHDMDQNTFVDIPAALNKPTDAQVKLTNHGQLFVSDYSLNSYHVYKLQIRNITLESNLKVSCSYYDRAHNTRQILGGFVSINGQLSTGSEANPKEDTSKSPKPNNATSAKINLDNGWYKTQFKALQEHIVVKRDTNTTSDLKYGCDSHIPNSVTFYAVISVGVVLVFLFVFGTGIISMKKVKSMVELPVISETNADPEYMTRIETVTSVESEGAFSRPLDHLVRANSQMHHNQVGTNSPVHHHPSGGNLQSRHHQVRDHSLLHHQVEANPPLHHREVGPNFGFPQQLRSDAHSKGAQESETSSTLSTSPTWTAASNAQIDVSPEYMTRIPAQTDVSPEYMTSIAAQTDVSPEYMTRILAQSDVSPEYMTRILPQSDVSPEYMTRIKTGLQSQEDTAMRALFITMVGRR